MNTAAAVAGWKRENQDRLIEGNCKCLQTIDSCHRRQQERRHKFTAIGLADVERPEHYFCVGCEYQIEVTGQEFVIREGKGAQSILTKPALKRASASFQKRLAAAAWRQKLPSTNRWAK